MEQLESEVGQATRIKKLAAAPLKDPGWARYREDLADIHVRVTG